MGRVPSTQVVLDWLECLHANVWRVPNHRIKPTRFHDLRELRLPVEDVDAVAFFVLEQRALVVFVEFGADEGVAALDVAGEVGQGTFVEELELVFEALLRFAFENLEEQRELGDLDSLEVDVHAEDVVEKDAAFFAGGQPPEAAWALIDFLGVFRWTIVDVPIAVPVQEALIGAEEKRAGAASGVED